MRYSPVGILSLIAARVLEVEDLMATLTSLAMYTVTVLAGLVIHSMISLPMIYFIATRRNPFAFIRGVVQALLTALGTASRYLRKNLSLKNFKVATLATNI